MNSSNWGLMLALSLGVAASAHAGDALQLQQVLDRALADNPAPQALAAALAASTAKVEQAGAWPEPQLSWAVAPNTFDNDAIGGRHVVTLAQPLIWSGKLGLRRQAQQADQAAVADDLAGLRLAVAAQARTAYARWYYVHRALDINARNRALLDELAAAALQGYSAGRGGQQSVVSADLRGALLQRQALGLERTRRQLEAAVNVLMGESVERPLPAPAALPELGAVPAREPLLAAVLDHNPQLQALARRRQAGELRVGAAERARWPDLRLMASYLGTLDPPDKRLQIGLGLELPLNQGARRAAVDEASAHVQRVGWEQQDLRLKLEQQASDQWAAAADADAQMRLYREAVLPLAAQNRAAAEADWRSGAGGFQAVIDALQDELDAQLAFEKLRVDGWMYRAALDRLTGGVMTAALFAGAEQ